MSLLPQIKNWEIRRLMTSMNVSVSKRRRFSAHLLIVLWVSCIAGARQMTFTLNIKASHSLSECPGE